MKLVIFTQNTMASIVATREILRENHEKVRAIVLASQLRGESLRDQIKVARKLIRRSSFSFFFYKLIESKLYNVLLSSHKIANSKHYRRGKAKGIEDLAKQYKIPIIRTNDLSDDTFLQKIKELNPDFIFCLVAQILRKNVFEVLGNKLVNAHGSYLPEYRGAAQYVWYLLNGDSQYGVTVHFMELGLDTGDIILQKRFDYNPGISVYKLHYDLSLTFGTMLNEFVEKYSDDMSAIPTIKQNEDEATETRLPTATDMTQLRKKGKKLIPIKDFINNI